MIPALAALLLAAAAPAPGATTARVRRGDLTIAVRVAGTVVAEDVFRLKSTIDGRVEGVNASSGTWRGSDEPLAMLAHKELAAIIDAKGSQDQSVMEDRWQRVYRPTPVRCPETCYVLKVYARARAWVKPNAVMFEAARRLKMVARVRPEDAHLVRDGQELTFWSRAHPEKKLTGRVARFVLDIQGENVDPGGSFALYMSPERYFPPGTEWEGEIVPSKKSDVLTVPTGALIRGPDGGTYLPLRVSTGTTTAEFTQVTSGAEEKREFLILDDAQLKGAERYKQTPDRAAVEKRRRELEAAAAGAPPPSEGEAAPPAPAPAARPDKEPASRQPSAVDDNGYGGEDPYGDQ